MGIEDLIGQAKDLYEQNKDAVDGALKSEQAEGIGDSVLDGAAGLAKNLLPDNLDGQIDAVRDGLDGAVGNE